MIPVARNDRRCKYNGGSCPNECAMDRHGHRQLSKCELHRHRASIYQAAYLKRMKEQQWLLSLRPAEPVVLAVQIAAVESTPSTIVVDVFAGETNAAVSVQRLSSTGEGSVPQPFVHVPSDSGEWLSDFLSCFATGGSDATIAAVGPHTPLMPQMMEAPALEQRETTDAMDLEPLTFEPEPSSDDAATPFVPHDEDGPNCSHE